MNGKARNLKKMEEAMKQQIEVIQKKRLKELLTKEEVEMVNNGKITFLTSSGERLNLEDDVDEGPIFPLSPLQGG